MGEAIGLRHVFRNFRNEKFAYSDNELASLVLQSHYSPELENIRFRIPKFIIEQEGRTSFPYGEILEMSAPLGKTYFTDNLCYDPFAKVWTYHFLCNDGVWRSGEVNEEVVRKRLSKSLFECMVLSANAELEEMTKSQQNL